MLVGREDKAPSAIRYFQYLTVGRSYMIAYLFDMAKVSRIANSYISNFRSGVISCASRTYAVSKCRSAHTRSTYASKALV